MQVENECKVTEIFCIIDDFCKEFSKIEQKKAILDGKRHRNKPNRMSDAEIILIMIMFHMGGYKCLKHYYIHHICKHCRHLFPKVVSYNRFVELERCDAGNGNVCQTMFAGGMYRNIVCGLHTTAGMQESADQHP